MPSNFTKYVKNDLFTKTSSKKSVLMGRIEYNRNGNFYTEELLKTFLSLIAYMQKEGFDINLILTPVHPDIWFNAKDSVMTLSSMQIETLFRTISNELGAKVYGSYDPSLVGCTKEEFYDSQHVHTSCLMKIKLNQH